MAHHFAGAKDFFRKTPTAALRSVLTRDFLIIAAINFFMLVAYYVIFVISTPYAIRFFNATPSEAGLTAGIIVIGCLVGRFFTGYLVGRVGCRVVLLTGLLIFTGSLALYFPVASLPGLCLVRFIGGVGVGFIGTATGTIVAYVVPKEHHGIGISFFSLSTALALAMGPFLGVTLVQIVTYPQLFGICLAVGCVSLACYMMLRVPNRLPGSEASSKNLLDLRNYIDYSVIPFACVVLVAAICWGNVQAFITFYAKELGLMGAASLFFLLYALTLILTRPASGKIYDLRGENVVVVPCLLLTALGLFLLGHAVSNWSMLLAGVLLGLAFGNFQSVSQAISLSLVPRERYAQATSTFFIFFDFGMGFGPYVFGSVASHAGYDGLYLTLCGVALVALVLYILLHGRKVEAFRA